MIVAVHMVAIPGTDKFFFMERPSGYHPDGSRTIAGFMDMRTAEWTHVDSPDGLFCCGHTLLDSGDLVVVGGHQANAGYPDGMKSVRTFSRSTTDTVLRKIMDMGWRRWYPTATLLPDGRVLIMGGTQGVGAGTTNNPFWEMLDPQPGNFSLKPYAVRTNYLVNAKQVYYPFNYVLPTGFLFTFCGRWGYILDWNKNSWWLDVPKLRGYATMQFPFTGTSVMLGLYPENNYQVDIMLFGGAKESTIKDLTTKANKNANRITLIWDQATKNYTFNGWRGETMRSMRVMPDVVLLPNGKVVVLNGAEEGLAGDSASGGESRANYPVFYAELYDPDLPEGQRFKKMAPTTIARMYHSTAGLTTNGTVVVAGCDRCFRFSVGKDQYYEPSPSKADYRVEIYSPPYFFAEAQKPQITQMTSSIMQFREPFIITYNFPRAPRGSNFTVTRVVLVAPSSCTHSFNTNQRVVGLEIVSDTPELGVLVVRGPPSIYIAPPQMYMLFLLNGDVYGSARWVTLRRPLTGPALLPMPY